MRAWLVVALLAGLGAGPALADEVDEGIDDFWAWLEADHAMFGEPGQSGEAHERLAYWLGRVDRGLSYELEARGKRRELTVSGDGRLGSVLVADRLVAAAPSIRHWKFRALRRRQRPLEPETVDGITLDPATTFFDMYRDGAQVGVVLYVPEVDPDRLDTLRVAARRLMSQAIGERNVAVEIGRAHV